MNEYPSNPSENPRVFESDHPFSGPPYNSAGPAAPFSTRRFLEFLGYYWRVPVLTVASALVLVGIYTLLAPPTFVSTARMCETARMRLPEGGAFNEDLQNYLGTQMELIRSDKVRELAFQQLRAQATNAIPLDRRGRPPRVDIQVEQAPKSTVLEIEASSSNPLFARAYLNAVMEAYLQYQKRFRQAVSGDTLTSLSEQLLHLENELKAGQAALTDFERTNNMAILEEEGRVAGGYLARLKTQLSDLELESQLLEASALEMDWTAAGQTNAASLLFSSLSDAASAPASPTFADRQNAWKELQVLKIQREKLGVYLRPKHPKIIKLDAEIERGQKLVDFYRSQNREELANARKALKMKRDSVQASIQQWEDKVVEANARIAESDHLKLEVKRTQSLYDSLLVLLQNVDISRNLDRESLAVFEPASPAERSHRRDLILFVLAIMGGASAGLGLVCLIQIRDDRFSSATEVDEKFGDIVVGQVPEVPEFGTNGNVPLIEYPNQMDQYAESYRNLRSALLFLPVESERPKILLLTSAQPGEGKSTIAVNLARTLALGGARVLLVDGDLRKGRLHEVMNRPGEPGLAELIDCPENSDSVLGADSRPQPVFLPHGRTPPNPGDLLLKPELDQLFARWRQQFDFVVIDSSPVFAADDVTTLAHKVDGTLLVVRRRFSRAAVVREALELLLHRQARVLGLIFNRADATAPAYHYYNYEDYHFSPGSTRDSAHGSSHRQPPGRERRVQMK